MNTSGSKDSFKTQWAESLNSYYFRVELPGFLPEDIDINIEQGELKITAVSESNSLESKGLAAGFSLGSSNLGVAENESFQADEFLRSEEFDVKKAPVGNSGSEAHFRSRRFQTSFQVPVDKVQIQNIHAFMEGENLVVKIPKLKPQDLPSFKIEVNKPKL